MTTHTFPHLPPKTRHATAASVGAISLALVLLLIAGLAYLRTTMRSTAPEASQPVVTAYRHTSSSPYASDAYVDYLSPASGQQAAAAYRHASSSAYASDAYVDYRWPASGQPVATTYRHTSSSPYASDAYVDYLWPDSAR
jgi:hypothetical protein